MFRLVSSRLVRLLMLQYQKSNKIYIYICYCYCYCCRFSDCFSLSFLRYLFVILGYICLFCCCCWWLACLFVVVIVEGIGVVYELSLWNEQQNKKQGLSSLSLFLPHTNINTRMKNNACMVVRGLSSSSSSSGNSVVVQWCWYSGK